MDRSGRPSISLLSLPASTMCLGSSCLIWGQCFSVSLHMLNTFSGQDLNGCSSLSGHKRASVVRGSPWLTPRFAQVMSLSANGVWSWASGLVGTGTGCIYTFLRRMEQRNRKERRRHDVAAEHLSSVHLCTSLMEHLDERPVRDPYLFTHEAEQQPCRRP